MSDDAADDRPMNEEEWERFMQKADARSAKYGELLETLIDHPECDEIVAHEMGWDRPGADDADWKEEDDADAFGTDEMFTDEELAEAEHEMREDDRLLHALPAYARGYEWSLAVHNSLQPFLDGIDGSDPDDWDPDDPLIVAFGDSLIVPAKLAGGHGMGFDESALCGNIVCCKRSLQAAERSLAALEELAQHGPPPRALVEPLLAEGRAVRELILQHIADLRSRVWWQ